MSQLNVPSDAIRTLIEIITAGSYRPRAVEFIQAVADVVSFVWSMLEQSDSGDGPIEMRDGETVGPLDSTGAVGVLQWLDAKPGQPRPLLDRELLEKLAAFLLPLVLEKLFGKASSKAES